jgi:uroporphyrinogen-III synthase
MQGSETQPFLERARILVTRPAHQAKALCDLIGAAGGEAILLPAIEIVPPKDPRAAQFVIDRLGDFNLAVFISANAVAYGDDLVSARRGSWPPALRIAAVGRRSAEQLALRGLPVDICPAAGYSSESLLADDALQEAQVAGKHVIVFRGEGGRELIADTLSGRGARVEYAEVYGRRPPSDGAAVFARLMREGWVDVVIVSSNEGLDNLLSMAGPARARLLQTRLVVISERTEAHARDLGFELTPCVATESSDAGLVEALRACYAPAGAGGLE